MQTIYHQKGVGLLWENQVHNRLNLDYYPFEWLHFTLEGRTRFQQGNMYSSIPGYEKMLGQDGGWVDLTYARGKNYNDDIAYVFTSMVDRASAEFTFGDFVGTLGRQRINWGQTFVWNPNDIFNSYSYFDVDYPERPGSDGLRLQYYTGMASNIELAAKIDSADQITMAGYFRFNKLAYDFQFIGGVLEEKDIILGAGWSGNILDASFRGEVSYFRDIENFSDTTGDFLISAGLDYTFGNSLGIQGEVLYSGFAKEQNVSNFMQVLGSKMSVKSIGLTEFSIFGSVSYPLSPLINASLAGIYFPDWKGIFIGPSFDFSITGTLKASLIFQTFSLELPDPSGISSRHNTFIGYARMRWSF
jgi:hypothetical protein